MTSPGSQAQGREAARCGDCGADNPQFVRVSAGPGYKEVPVCKACVIPKDAWPFPGGLG